MFKQYVYTCNHLDMVFPRFNIAPSYMYFDSAFTQTKVSMQQYIVTITILLFARVHSSDTG